MSSPVPIKIGLISLGCAKNLVDSEVMLGALLKNGMQLIENAREADVLIINTCGFIEASKQESINTILEAGQLRQNGPCRALIVSGCLTQRYPKELRSELPEVDAIIGLNEVPRIAEIVRDILGRDKASAPGLFWSGPARYVPDYHAPRYRLTPGHYAYVKIAEGCNHPCTFCSIPRIRGRHRSRPLNDVLDEIGSLVRDGVKEINLISQDTTFYGKDLDPNAPGPHDGRGMLSELLREIQAIPGDFWVRLLYTHPYHWTDDLIQTMADGDKLCRYVDIPLQHINDSVLKRMRRETDGAFIRDLIGRIRSGIPGIAIRTTFIVGFPGETESQFEELLEFIEQARFERLGVFTYSQEDHTPAGNLTPQVSAKVKKERHHRVMTLQQRVAREIHRSYIGRTMRVLVEKQTAHGWVGRSEADAPEIDGSIRFTGRSQLGGFADIQITDASVYDLVGKVV